MNTFFLYDFIFSSFFLVFLINTSRNVFFQVFLWQLKEYRLDRMIAHLKTDQGRKLLLNPLSIMKWVLFINLVIGISGWIVFSTYSLFLNLNILFSYLLFGILWVVEAGLNLIKLSRWKFPIFSLKAILITAAVLITQFSPLILLSNNLKEAIIIQVMLSPFLDKLLAISTSFIVFISAVPSIILKKIILYFAQKKITGFPKLMVIGITGSFGKTSTKEFLTQMLETKFRVLKTSEFQNTPLAIAMTILRKLNHQHQVFIVEMGAYKKGEIEQIAKMVRPQIGIITGLNEQHLELFGSIEETIRTKFELIKNLSVNGNAIFNSENLLIKKMIDKASKDRPDLHIWEFRQNNIRISENIRILSVRNILVSPGKINFTLNYNNHSEIIESKLCGSQNIPNISLASICALILGLNLKRLKHVISSLKPPLKTMRLVQGDKMTFIDDTYNANPDGVKAAIEYMKLYSGKKILIMSPLIELGSSSSKIHEGLGELAGKVCDLILLTNINYSQYFINGVSKVTDIEKVQIVNTNLAVRIINNIPDAKGIVLFEGKEAGKILDTLA